MTKPKKGKKFNYSLQTLLKVREIRERQEQDKFIEAEKVLTEEQKKEEEAINLRDAHYQTLLDKMSSGELPDVNEIQLRKAYIDVLKGKAEEQTKVREDAETKKDEQREKLNKAVMDKKIMEKDRVKTREAWVKLMAKEEAKFMDEIASISFAKKQKLAKEEQQKQARSEPED